MPPARRYRAVTSHWRHARFSRHYGGGKRGNSNGTLGFRRARRSDRLTPGAADLDPAPVWWRGLAPILVLAFILGAAIAPSIGMAFNIEAVAKRFGGSNAAYGLLATVELLSIAAGTLAGSRLAGRLGPRRPRA